MILFILSALPLSFSQFDFLTDIAPPPWHHRHPPSFGRWHHPRPPFDHWHHPPWRTFPFLPPPVFLPPPPPPVPSPPVPQPQLLPSPYTVEMQTVIKSINKKSEHFSKSGESYENVIDVLKKFYTKKSGVQYDIAHFKQPNRAERSELTANQRTAGIFYENDVVLTLSQAKTITSETNRKKRKVVSDLTKRWTRSISFRFQENDEEWKTSIRSAISLFTSSTCLSFIENAPFRDYLIFTKGEGCYSSVGRLGGSQEVSIGFGCEGEGVISHEIAHSLGLWHEQSRSDRNNFVKIYPQNVINGAQAQFERLNNSISTDYGVPYDYGSVMHYPAHAFARQNGMTSIEPTDRAFKNTIGSRVSLSFLDLKVINSAYCSNICSQALPCQNNGYTHPNACTRCLCPSGFSGKFCENLEYSESGEELIATNNWKTLSFKGSQESFWSIKVSNGDRIAFEFTSIWFKCSQSCEEFVEIKYGYRMDQTGSRLCCRQDFGQRTSYSNQVVIIVRATSQSNFTLNYKLAPGQRTSQKPQEKQKPILSDTSKWSGWSSWSTCSEACGACGKEERFRTCMNHACRLHSRQSQARTCNLTPCRSGTTRGRESRSLPGTNMRIKRQTSWCCAGYKKTSNNWCSQV